MHNYTVACSVPNSLELNYLTSTSLSEVVVVFLFFFFRAVRKDQAQNLITFAIYLPVGDNEPSIFQEWAF